MQTPFFQSWRAFLAPLKSRPTPAGHPLQRATLSQIEDQLAPALPADLLRQPLRGPHSRKRIYFLERTFWCAVWQILQANTSGREVVRQLQALHSLLAETRTDEATSAYFQARAALPLTVLQRACQASAASARQAAPRTPPVLQGRPVKFVDASSVRLEDTPANRAEFPPPSNQFHSPAFPTLKLLALFELASGAIIAHATGDLHQAETRLLLSLEQYIHPGDIVGGDRAYGQFVVAHWAQRIGADLLARVNTRSRHVNFAQATKLLGEGDALFTWHKPVSPSKLLTPQQWAEVPATLTVRIIQIKVDRPGFRSREITLVTTLLDAELYPAREITGAFLKRWRLEMSLDDLKTTLGMEQLKARSPEVVQRELLLFLIAHNLLRWLMAGAAKHSDGELERISFKGTLDAFRQWSSALAQVRGPGKAAKQRRMWRELLSGDGQNQPLGVESKPASLRMR